jgi:molecular chaperone GrpE
MSEKKSGPRTGNEDQANAANSELRRPNGDPAAQPREDLQALAAENADLRDRVLRTLADMENLRRRVEREKDDIARYGIAKFARDILTIGDNLRRTIEHVPAEAAAQDPALKNFLEGVELTERELHNVLERYGVKRIEPIGQRFDPNSHQAMYEVPNPDVPEGTVVDVLQAGYVIGDRTLRPALVAVAKGGLKPAPETPPRAANDDYPNRVPPRGPAGPGTSGNN